MDPRSVVRSLAVGRVGIGLALFAAPRLAARGWIGGEDAARPGAQVAVRGLGARDVVLGVGMLVSLARGSDVHRWLEAGIVADAADAIATALAGGEDSDVARVLPLTVATGAAALGAWAGAQLDD